MEGITLDPWQQSVMDTKGNITMRCGRQTGKSTVVSMKAVDFAMKHPETVTLVIAASQKQSGFIFEKMKGVIHAIDEPIIADALKGMRKLGRIKEIRDEVTLYSEPPTKTRIVLKNGSRIYSLPAGRTGVFIRGLTIDLLIVDEAAYIPEPVWNSVLPMIAVSRKLRGLGWIILLSTPFGKGGYFFNTHHDTEFRQFHVSSEKCSRIPADFLRKERSRMTKQEYAQEYLAEFIDDYNQFFATPLIKKCMSMFDWTFESYDGLKSYYMGVDFARYGADENAFVILEMDNKRTMRIIKALTTERKAITETVGRILDLHDKFKFKKIFVDDAGVGGGATDMLIEKLGRRIVGLNNAKRSVDKTGKVGRLLKEDLYSNALVLMEGGKIEMISDLGLLKSLKSIVFEYTADKNLKLFGNYSHLAEAFVRVAWAIKDRGLRLFIN